MKKLGCLIIMLSVLVSVAGTAFAEGEVEFEITADFFSKYIWRGQNLDDDYVFQPGITAVYGNLTAGVWGNLEMTNINDKSGDMSEVDYYLDWSDDLAGFEGVGYSVGVIYYDFPSTYAGGAFTSDTIEFYWGLSFSDLPLSPSVTVYHDAAEAEGTYASFAVGHSVEKVAELGPDTPVGMEISASLGYASGSYNKYYWGTDQAKTQDLAFSVSLPFNIADWSVTPSFNYVTLVSDDIRKTDTYGTDSDFFFTGISLSKSF